MTHCAKCGAELIGTRRFCTACGAPAGDPRSPAASTGMSPASPGSAPASSRTAGGAALSSGPSIQYAPPGPISQVSPFAQTAGSAGPGLPERSPAAPSSYGPPPSIPLALASTTPGVGDPTKGPQVSPLATSNVASNRAAFGDAISSARPAPPDSTPSIKRGMPGTQLMPSMANPSVGAGAPSVPRPSSGGQKPAGTQLIGVFPGVAGVRPASTPPRVPATPEPQTAPLHMPPPTPIVQHVGPGVPLPSSHQGWNPAPAYAPPPPPVAAPPPSYGYAPGSRVQVTWSDGRRYPGTVQQVSGTQCLVVFPDGQHHWVEMLYVAPA